MDKIIKKVLDYYQIDKEEFLDIVKEPSEEIFDFAYTCPLFIKAKEVISNSILNKEKIMIYGDYDCDGITSTSIILNTLYLLNNESLQNISFFIPSRVEDGYGLNLTNAQKIVDKKFDLVILVDNGITLKNEIAYLKEHNIKVVVIDHHEINEEKLPSPDVLIHYKYINELKYQNISAGGLSFLTSICLLGKMDYYLFSLGALSIISDVMPMKGFNHKFVKLALKTLNISKNSRFHHLIKEVFDKNGKIYNVSKISEDELSSYIIPKINSAGRLPTKEVLKEAVNTFFIGNLDYLKSFEIILNVDSERKNILNTYLESHQIKELNNNYLLIVEKELEEGLIGLLANKYLEQYQVPTIILTYNKNTNLYKGSMRTKKGISVIDFLNFSFELLPHYGGHENAGGFDIKEENIPLLENKLKLYLESNKIARVSDKYMELDKIDISKHTYLILQSLKPYGNLFEKPKLKLLNVSPKNLNKSKDGKHLLAKINDEGTIVYFGFPQELLSYDEVNLIGTIKKNVFYSKITYQFIASDYEIVK